MINTSFAKKLLGACALVSAFTLHAAEQKGSHSLNYGFSLSSEEQQQAQQLAIQNAVERWVVEKNPEHFENYKVMKAEINANIDDYVLGVDTQSERDRKNKLYIVTARVNINEQALLDTLLERTEVVNGEQKYLTFVFVAREKVGSESNSFREATQGKEQTDSVSKERDANSASQSKGRDQTVRRENREIKYKDKPLWNVATTNEIDTAMNSVFARANYRVVEAATLEEETGGSLLIANFVDDFRFGDDVQSQTQGDAIKGLQSVNAIDPSKDDDISYFAVGSLTIDEEQVDKRTGNITTFVSITAKILDISGRRSFTAASVGSVVVKGEGPTSLVARNNALKLAAERAAEQLVGQLSSKQIR